MELNTIPNNIIISSKRQYSSNMFKKYLKEQSLENPNLKFSEKDCEINMKLIEKMDTQNLFEKKNNIYLQKLVDNLVTAKFYKSDYDEDYKYFLFKSFQNCLDYLIEKKKRISKINTDLNNYFSNIKKKANDLEKKLESNKILIEEKAKIKNENKLKYEDIKKKYKEMKKKNENIEIEKPKIIKEENVTNIESNIESNIKVKVSQNKNEVREINNKFFCDVCANKYFSTKENLEDHQIKRHPFIIIQKPKEKNENKLKIIYDKKLDSLKDYIQNSFNVQKNDEKKKDSIKELLKNLENDNIFLNNMIKNQQKSFEETKSLINNLNEDRKKCINELEIIYGLQKTEEDLKKEKIKKRKKQKKFEKTIKEKILNDQLMQNLNQKIKDLYTQLNNYILSQNKERNKELEENKDENNMMKNKNLSIIEEFPISQIKEDEEEKEKNEISDEKNKQIINAIINSSIKEENKEYIKNKEEEKLEGQKEKEEKVSNGIEQEERKENEIKKEEKKIEEDNDKVEEEEYEEEEEEENNSILSNKEKISSLDIIRIKNANDLEQQNEMPNLVDNIFIENNVNFNLNQNIKDNKNVFDIKKNSDSENIKLKNENKQMKKVENIIFEIPIQTNKKFKDFQIELDELLK